ncbi:hypothetical protein B0T14DRAFT_602779 [Immersiella caudata]|uniref:Uncharacterized protein n=1 Tax=Immersiella caudata TaxID=314043 RepID=A0AA39WNS6_9PEZI|nr:hypothetical protein B0T14DRAFT_602779 [Immersiella caudata]
MYPLVNRMELGFFEVGSPFSAPNGAPGSPTNPQRQESESGTEIQFIVFQPSANDGKKTRQNVSTNSRMAIHSHAARVVHARRRQARTLAYHTNQSHHGARTPLDLPNGQRVQTSAPPWSYLTPTTVVDKYRRSDPFNSFARALSPNLACIVPMIESGCWRLRALEASQRESLALDWLHLALSNLDFLNGLFLNASRLLSVRHEQEEQREKFAGLAVRYKLLCVKFVIDSIKETTGARELDDIPIAETLVLAFDEKLLGDGVMARRHIEGAIGMVNLKGGPQTLGMNGLLAMMLAKYSEDVGIVTPPTDWD